MWTFIINRHKDTYVPMSTYSHVPTYVHMSSFSMSAWHLVLSGYSSYPFLVTLPMFEYLFLKRGTVCVWRKRQRPQPLLAFFEAAYGGLTLLYVSSAAFRKLMVVKKQQKQPQPRGKVRARSRSVGALYFIHFSGRLLTTTAATLASSLLSAH